MSVQKESILLIAFLILGISSCTKGLIISSEQIAASYDILSVRDRWGEAMTLARQWDEGAYVNKVMVDVPLPNGNRGLSPVVIFDLQTRNNDYIGLTISCNEYRCKKFPVAQEEGYPVIHSTPVTLEDFSLDSEDAFKVSLEGGGRKYLSCHNATLILFLYHEESIGQGKAVWKFSITDYSRGADFNLIIDASTGEVIK